MASAEAFKVIIAGGGIAGLTLANMLEKFDIDYILLESYSSIAPAVGASIGLFPNGLRILDQLGLYEQIEEIFSPEVPYNTSHTRSEKGDVLSTITGFFAQIEKRYVYLGPVHECISEGFLGMDTVCSSLTGKRC